MEKVLVSEFHIPLTSFLLPSYYTSAAPPSVIRSFLTLADDYDWRIFFLFIIISCWGAFGTISLLSLSPLTSAQHTQSHTLGGKVLLPQLSSSQKKIKAKAPPNTQWRGKGKAERMRVSVVVWLVRPSQVKEVASGELLLNLCPPSSLIPFLANIFFPLPF